MPAALARSHPPEPPKPPPVLPVLGAPPAEAAPAEPLPQTMLSQTGEATSPPSAKSGPDDDVEIVLPT